MLKPKVLPWEQHKCYSVQFVMYISGVRFEDTAPIFQEIFLMQYFIVLSLLPNGIIVQKR